MALLERVVLMKNQGISENQIINSLKEENFSPLEINEAISQSRIKAALSTQETENMNQEENPNQDASINQQENYEQNQQPQYSQEQQYPQYAQEQALPEIPQDQNQQYPQYAQEQYGQQYYDPNQQQGYYSQTLDVDSVREIAKQEVEGITGKIKKEIDSLTKLKTDVNFEIQNLDNRLKKVESIIQELEKSIIKKIGEYGESIAGISHEMRETQKSFSKVINPLVDKQRGITSKETFDESTDSPSEEIITTQTKVVKHKKTSQKKSKPTHSKTHTHPTNNSSGHHLSGVEHFLR